MLNILWLSLFFAAFASAGYQALILGDSAVLRALLPALFDGAKTAFEVTLGLVAVLALWLGLMRIAERSGLVETLTWVLAPLLRRLAPEIPKDHPALAAMTMNIAANLLGLDNAATPLGIKAMRELQTLNTTPDVASNAQILFLVINSSSVTLLPVSIFAYRAQLGASQPTDVFLPILLATYCSTLMGFLLVAWYQRINLLDRVILAYVLGGTALLALLIGYGAGLDSQRLIEQSALFSQVIILTLILIFLAAAVWRKIDAYAAFVEGAKEGWQTGMMIFPYLLAMLCAIGLFRASGLLDGLLAVTRGLLAKASLDSRFVEALPTAFIKPFSGSGARALMVDAIHRHGADSFVGRLVAIMQGSTETTFYVLAVYFGAAGIKRIRHAAVCALAADAAGLTAAIAITYLWFA